MKILGVVMVRKKWRGGCCYGCEMVKETMGFSVKGVWRRKIDFSLFTAWFLLPVQCSASVFIEVMDIFEEVKDGQGWAKDGPVI